MNIGTFMEAVTDACRFPADHPYHLSRHRGERRKGALFSCERGASAVRWRGRVRKGGKGGGFYIPRFMDPYCLL